MEELKIICPFCNKPYTAEMVEELDSASGCNTCGTNSISGVIEIKCKHCKKVVYRKYIDR